MTSKILSESKSVLGSLLKILPGKGAAKAADNGPRDREAIQTWMVARVAEALAVPPEQIDVREPFASFGLDSRTAVSLSGDLERWCGRRLSPTLVWDYPTIEAVTQYLADGVENPDSLAEDDAQIPGLVRESSWSES